MYFLRDDFVEARFKVRLGGDNLLADKKVVFKILVWHSPCALVVEVLIVQI